MTDSELRDAAARAAMAAMGASPALDPFVLQEEQRGGEVNTGHHGMGGGGGSDLLGNTEDSEETSGSPVKFVSGEDSNVVVYTKDDELRIDVYYK